jgi:hypothetical protein
MTRLSRRPGSVRRRAVSAGQPGVGRRAAVPGRRRAFKFSAGLGRASESLPGHGPGSSTCKSSSAAASESVTDSDGHGVTVTVARAGSRASDFESFKFANKLPRAALSLRL